MPYSVATNEFLEVTSATFAGLIADMNTAGEDHWMLIGGVITAPGGGPPFSVIMYRSFIPDPAP